MYYINFEDWKLIDPNDQMIWNFAEAWNDFEYFTYIPDTCADLHYEFFKFDLNLHLYKLYWQVLDFLVYILSNIVGSRKIDRFLLFDKFIIIICQKFCSWQNYELTWSFLLYGFVSILFVALVNWL